MVELIGIFRLGSSLCLAILAGHAVLDRLSEGRKAAHSQMVRLLTILIPMMLVGQLVTSAYLASPDDGRLAWKPIAVLATETWGGNVLLGRLGLALVLTALAWASKLQSHPAASALIFANLFLLPFSGHATSSEPAGLSLLFHGIHTATVLTWAGSVILLAASTSRTHDEFELHKAITRFSPLAFGLVSIGIGTGVVAGYFQIGPPAALFGTPYGQLLLLKAGLLLGVALGSAAWLRWKYLPNGHLYSPRNSLLLEAAMCIGMLAIASYMSQSIPGRHADVVWPLPFRFDWQLLTPGKDTATILISHLVFAAVMLFVAIAGGATRRWGLAASTSFVGLLIGGLGLSGLVVQAYPTTFAASPSTYSTDRLVSAELVFVRQCSFCHGETGHGDGPAMRAVGALAADLTAPHTGDHTTGDMYWWITHGKLDTVMEGVEAETTEQDRWDLVNYVRLLTNSARSIDVGFDVNPMKPILPSIDFGFTVSGGAYVTLRDLEGQQPVLLVLAREKGSVERVKELEAHRTAIEAARLLVVIVCGPETQEILLEKDRGSSFVVVKTGADAIIRGWSYYRRTRAFLDRDDHAVNVGHQEYLIDRFGYVRAKWRTDDGMFPSVETIMEQVKSLNSEPRILASPEEHLH